MHRTLTAIALLSLFGTTAACSKDDPAPVDASSTVDASPDAPSEASAPGCNLDAPFEQAKLVEYRPSSDAGAIPLSGVLRLNATNETSGAFDAVQGPSTKIFLATRSGDGFLGADEIAASPTVVHSSPALSRGGKYVFFSAVASGKSAIHRITSDGKDFTSAELWLGNPQADLVMPYLANDAALYFVQGSTAMQVSVGGPDASGKAGTPTPVAGVPTTVNALAVNADETILYYGEGNSFDTAAIHEMRKTGGAWVAQGTAPLTIPGLQKLESPTWLSADGCRIYVRAWPSVVDRALYVATKPKK